METCAYMGFNIDQDAAHVAAEPQRFLNQYYGAAYSPRQGGGTFGPPELCAATIREFAAAGADTLGVRLIGYDQTGQLRRFLEQGLPLL